MEPEKPDQLRAARLRALGRAIHSRRETLGLSQRQLADAMGTHQNDIYRIEHGRNALGADRLWLLCDALEITPSGLFMSAETLEAREYSD